MSAKCRTFGISKDRHHPDSCDIPYVLHIVATTFPTIATYRTSCTSSQQRSRQLRHTVHPVHNTNPGNARGLFGQNLSFTEDFLWMALTD